MRNETFSGVVAAAEDYADPVHTAYVTNQEVRFALPWIWTRVAIVAEMDLETKIAEHSLVKESTRPSLYKNVSILCAIEKLEAYLYSVKRRVSMGSNQAGLARLQMSEAIPTAIDSLLSTALST